MTFMAHARSNNQSSPNCEVGHVDGAVKPHSFRTTLLREGSAGLHGSLSKFPGIHASFGSRRLDLPVQNYIFFCLVKTTV